MESRRSETMESRRSEKSKMGSYFLLERQIRQIFRTEEEVATTIKSALNPSIKYVVLKSIRPTHRENQIATVVTSKSMAQKGPG